MRNLKRLVNQRLKEVLPRFMPGFFDTLYNQDVPNVQAFTKKHSDGLYFHVVPTVVPLQNYFTCEVCVMRTGRSPIHSFIGSPEQTIDASLYDMDGMRFTASLLWSDFPLSWMVCEDPSQAGLDDVAITMPPLDARKWVASHPELYETEPDPDQLLVWPLVDDMVLKAAPHAERFFAKMGEQYG